MYGHDIRGVGVESTSKLNEYRPSLTQRLTAERQDLAERLAEVDAALAALNAQPDIQKILDLVQKVARY